MKRLMLTLMVFSAFAVSPSVSNAQDVLDGIYRPEHTLERRVIPYAPLREADIMWLKRVWRRIDLREKINHPMYFPEKPAQGRKSLFDVMKDAILNDGTLTAYDPGPLGDDDMFTKRMTTDEVRNLLFRKDTSLTEDLITGEMKEVIVNMETKSTEVKWYEIKEEWFFDRQRSVMDVRTIGICPMIAKTDELTGEFRGLKQLFWVYYPEARYVFVKSEVFNRSNDVERRTYEDIFWKRQFGSFITKESNVYNRSISEYETGLEALIEAENIKQEITNMEHDLWSY
ncbi:MAG: gliding motility protein GldN [Salibacteraceae bacterium]